MAPLYEDIERIINRLPSTSGECRRLRHLVLQQNLDTSITDEAISDVIPNCRNLLSIVLSGVPDITDRTVVELASTAVNLQGLDLSGCNQVTDVGILELTAKSLPLEWVQLNGVTGVTDPSISAIAKSCSRLVELELCDLPLLTPKPVRDLWSYSRKLRTLRLARCSLLSDKAFPSVLHTADESDEKPLPPTPATWLEEIPPLVLHHTAENLRVLDIGYCAKITDDAIAGVVAHAPKIQSLDLSGCVALTDVALEHICRLGDNLDTLTMAHVPHITDRGIVKLVRACGSLRSVDFAFCRHLTDMTVLEIAVLPNLQRLSLVRVQNLTDNAVFALAEHATALERLHLSYCDGISLSAVHLMLRKLGKLQLLIANGVPALKRKGIKRFSDPPPSNYDADLQAAFRVFSGANVVALREFLDKELLRRRNAERSNMVFIPRGDDKLDLY
ncbi:RNI-like protein [Athelia psychrophila]|uniref:RNI-like protein n=1 Tax=Athelia psychrophila TaxID=1759441 RepID=A0A167VE87_9AGAM|nr:RNI-like protein [Fibularhizoctonia sp. CBS 109695]